MSLIRNLMSKPWETPGYTEPNPADVTMPFEDKKVGLWVFLGVVVSVFGLFTVAYNMRIVLATDWIVMPKPGILWVNTAVLIMASVAFERAKFSAHRKRVNGIKYGMLAGGLLTIAFLIGQWMAWQEMQNAGYFINGNASYAFFYLITGMHALHLIGGLYVWARAMTRIFKGYEATLSVELCTTYWHCLLLIWIVLYGLLLST